METRWDEAAGERGFWSESRSAARGPQPEAGGRVAVQALLFGTLAPAGGAAPIRLEFHHPFSARDVIEALAQRLGDTFRARVLDAAGRKVRHCRVFADGVPVEDVDARIAPATRIEMILLTAAEGG